MSTPCHPILAFLIDRTPHFGATIIKAEGNKLYVTIVVKLTDGRRIPYELEIQLNGTKINVREERPQRLSGACPERHINFDGTFCMYWDIADPLKIDSTESADRWWGTLVQFLKLQERAAKQQRWPSDEAWPHGDAAKHQHEAEQSAKFLGEMLLTDVRKNRLRVVRAHLGGCQNGAILRMYRETELLYSVWERSRRVTRLRNPCPCGKRCKRGIKQLRSCDGHEQLTAKLVFAIYEKQLAEIEYLETMSKRECCGCMLSCPLKK
ncbi:E2 domain-containing protein [Collimonas fungivorans]|uniref:E2 domain-containing protein n=1 Tax=Collimonas fungivorans TaxID=158899 RepID=UPI000AF5745B|nr:E2 domain-containing protein [Collimonas fungivorans]